MEMDNYFVDRQLTPRDENGEMDFESLSTLNTNRLNTDLQRLITGEEVQIPKYLFIEGHSIPGDTIQTSKDQIVILEGIICRLGSIRNCYRRSILHRLFAFMFHVSLS